MSEEINITVKNVKEFEAHDGKGFNCTVYLNDKRFCHALDDGWGGGLMFSHLSKTSENPNTEIMRINEVIKANPDKYSYKYKHLQLFKDFEWLVNDAVNTFCKEKEIKRMKKMMTKRVLFVKPDSKKGCYTQSNILKSPAHFADIKKQFKEENPDIKFLDEGDNLEKFFERLHAKVVG